MAEGITNPAYEATDGESDVIIVLNNSKNNGELLDLKSYCDNEADNPKREVQSINNITSKDFIKKAIDGTILKDFNKTIKENSGSLNINVSTDVSRIASYDGSNSNYGIKTDEVVDWMVNKDLNYNKDFVKDVFNVDPYVNNDSSNSNEIKAKSENDYNDFKDNEEGVVKFSGHVLRSFREKPIRSMWKRRSLGHKSEEFPDMNVTPELSRSQYSLVSNLDLTAGAVQLWMGLPEEVKYDPALAPFRQFYEKEYGKLDNISQKVKNGSVPKIKRLPAVNSAPHLNNNLHISRDDVVFNEKKYQDEHTQDKLLETEQTQRRSTKMARARNYIKITLLLACWVFFTAVFMMYNEEIVVTRNSSVAPGEIKNYVLETRNDHISVMLKLSGPFLSEIGEKKLNDNDKNSSRKMEIWLERRPTPDKRMLLSNFDAIQVSEKHHILLLEEDLDFSEGEKRSTFLTLKSNGLSDSYTYALRMRTDANQTTPFAMSYKIDPLDVTTGLIYSALLLCGLYVIIIFEVINRTMAAILLSTTSLAALALAGVRPSFSEVISWIDVETLLLLFSMMLLVAIMAETGMFDFLAVFTFEVTKGKLWPLISLLCVITAVLSTFLDNVTTVLLMTPVTIRLCEVMELDPIPVLMSMVLYSNVGGTATPVGDPPNVIIASNKAVIQAGVNFTNFTLHMSVGILFVCIQTYVQLRFIYRDVKKLRLNEPRDVLELRRQISIWRRATESLPQLSKDQIVVKERLEKKIKKLSAELEFMIKESKIRGCPKETFQSTLQEMKAKYKIRDKALLVKSTVAISFVVLVFFLHSMPELKRVSLGWTALLGAILLLTLADRDDLEPILHRVEWSTLLFFAALFVLMEALSKLGLIEFIGGLTESIILQVDESARLAVAILLMLWVSGLTSAFVDNIPLTTMMVRVVTSLGSNPDLNLPMTPLIWALAFGACLGGNGTLIGASANVVCAGVAEQHGYKFTFVQFFKIGFPIMIGHLIVASGYLLLCHCVFSWH